MKKILTLSSIFLLIWITSFAVSSDAKAANQKVTEIQAIKDLLSDTNHSLLIKFNIDYEKDGSLVYSDAGQINFQNNMYRVILPNLMIYNDLDIFSIYQIGTKELYIYDAEEIIDQKDFKSNPLMIFTSSDDFVLMENSDSLVNESNSKGISGVKTYIYKPIYKSGSISNVTLRFDSKGNILSVMYVTVKSKFTAYIYSIIKENILSDSFFQLDTKTISKDVEVTDLR
ncbi:MAG: hypothetical protein WC140_07520 [Bacteroidales bacterium]